VRNPAQLRLVESGYPAFEVRFMSNELLTDAELETLYATLCNGVETLYQQSEAQRGLARVLFYALNSFLAERGGAENIEMVANWTEQREGHDERTCSYRDALLG
jgi:hypothetical protein